MNEQVDRKPISSAANRQKIGGETEGETGSPRLEPSGEAGHLDDRQEIGGPKGPEPTRYGDWERKGRCIDF
jgi:hypothetical protein